MKLILIVLLLSLSAKLAATHSSSIETVPADGAVENQAPSSVVIRFDAKIRLTRVILTFEDWEGVTLDLAGNESFTDEIAIPVKDQGSGGYLIEWRGLSIDGHVRQGKFSFSIE